MAELLTIVAHAWCVDCVDLQALQLVRGGILQKTLRFANPFCPPLLSRLLSGWWSICSLAVSDDVLTRTKARSALAQFVRGTFLSLVLLR